MKHNKLELYLHLVWVTWDRQPLLTVQISGRVHGCIAGEAASLQCRVLALGGVEDLVHILLTFPTTICVAQLVKQLKGVSSHFVNDTLRPPLPFKWQGHYGALTVSRADVPRVIDYIRDQKQHHAARQLQPEFESTCVEVQPPAGAAARD